MLERPPSNLDPHQVAGLQGQFTVGMQLAHASSLLTGHGLISFSGYLRQIYEEVVKSGTASAAKKRVINSPAFEILLKTLNQVEISTERGGGTNHPKLLKLEEVLGK
jgi:ERCC4-related helicase